MAEHDLKPKDLELIEFAFSVFNEDGVIDGANLPQMIRCLNLNPSIERMEKLGATEKRGEKKYKMEELYPIISQLKKDVKDMGCYEDFIECLKLYDKNENGKMLAGELSHSFSSLGEKMTEEQLDELFEDCLDEENDEGEIDYAPFLRRMCEREPPIPKKKAA